LMYQPIYIHAATRTKSYGYTPDHGYSQAEITRPLSKLLSVPANDILREVPVPIDAVFVSNQFPDNDRGEELVVNQLVDSLRWYDQRNKVELRLSGVTCVRVETATNGLTALKLAVDHLKAHSGDTVMVIGGEKVIPAQFHDLDYCKTHFEDWAEGTINRIASALAPRDRIHLRCMPAAMGLILNCYARMRLIDYTELKKLIERLAIRAYENVCHNPNAFQRYHKLFASKNVRRVYGDSKENPILVYPMRKLDMSPTNDGAGALLLSRHQKLEMLNGGTSTSDVAITGCAIAQDTLSLTERTSLDSFPATTLAAKRAYVQAKLDLRKWQNELGPLIVEQHDAFIPLTLINLEDLLLFHNHTEVISFLKDKYLNGQDYPLWLNPSGGLMEGHPFAGTAIIKTAECYARLTSRSGPMGNFVPTELKDSRAKTAIVQSFGGIGGNAGVAVLDRCSPTTGNAVRSLGETDHYLNLGSRLEVVKSVSSDLAQDQIVSIVRIQMPFVNDKDQFTDESGLRVVALVQKPQGRTYAHAVPGTEEAELSPEDICNEDIFVRLDEMGDSLSFTIERRQPRRRARFHTV
jgi:acetyl-CoA acetyltransferase